MAGCTWDVIATETVGVGAVVVATTTKGVLAISVCKFKIEIEVEMSPSREERRERGGLTTLCRGSRNNSSRRSRRP